ncbi:MAG: ECF-type sigma factor [Rhodanobacteraceae bacterium]
MTGDVTALIKAADGGDADALQALFGRVYGELKYLARKQLVASSGHTLKTTELVHEAYLKLARPEALSMQSRVHFFALAAKAMRQIVIDHARARLADKRGGPDAYVVELSEANDVASPELGSDALLQLDRALELLETTDPHLARLVELRFFTGLSIADVAVLQSLSERTVVRNWRRAKVRLYAAMHPDA